MDPLEVVTKVFEVARWIYDQLAVIRENASECRSLADRIYRLSGVTNALRTQLKPANRQLSNEILSCLSHVESFFGELEAMLEAHNGQKYPAGFLGKAKAAFAHAKDFFGAQNWRDQLISANDKLDRVLADLETSIVAQGFVTTVGIAKGVQRLEDDMKAMMRAQLSQAAPADGFGIPTYFPSQVTHRKQIDKGGNSHIFEAEFPDSVHKIAYKRCSLPSFHSICPPPPHHAAPLPRHSQLCLSVKLRGKRLSGKLVAEVKAEAEFAFSIQHDNILRV